MKYKLGMLNRGLYIRLNEDGVKKDLALVKNHGIPPSRMSDFIRWTAIERTIYENDIYDEIDTYLKFKYDRVKEWNRIKKKEKFFERLVERDGAICNNKLCGSLEKLTIDHLISPLLDGENSMYNLQLLCLPCNSSKGKKLDWDGIVKNRKIKK